MKIVCISDTHSRHRIFSERDGGLPYGDVLIHAGDACMRGSPQEFAAFANWFIAQPHKWKLYVPGNHDFMVARDADLCRGMLEWPGCRMLIDQAVTIDGLKFYGTPWIPNLSGWAFFASAQHLRDKFADIPTDVDVLITHGPPSSILDVILNMFTIGDCHGLIEDEWTDEKGLHVGSVALLARIKELTKLKLHVFGHIHESYGQDGVHVNAAICNRAYEPDNPPIVVEIVNVS